MQLDKPRWHLQQHSLQHLALAFSTRAAVQKLCESSQASSLSLRLHQERPRQQEVCLLESKLQRMRIRSLWSANSWNFWNCLRAALQHISSRAFPGTSCAPPQTCHACTPLLSGSPLGSLPPEFNGKNVAGEFLPLSCGIMQC